MGGERTRAAEAALRRCLHDLAWSVAARLDAGEVSPALAVTRELERLAALCWPEELEDGLPPAPVVGRRFARAHRTLLSAAPRERLAALAGIRRMLAQSPLEASSALPHSDDRSPQSEGELAKEECDGRSAPGRGARHPGYRAV